MSSDRSLGQAMNMSATPSISEKFARRAKFGAVLLGTYALLGGLLSFCGWALDIHRLTDWQGNGLSIQPNTTIAVAFSGVAIILLALGRERAAGYAGTIPLAIGFITVCEYILGVDPGFDQLLMFSREWGRRGVLIPGRMGPPSTVSWTLLGLALVIAGLFPRSRRLVPYLALTAVAIALLTFVGSLYGADFLYTLPRLTVIAAQTSTFILATGIGITLTLTDREPVRTILGDNAGGIMDPVI